MDEEKRDQELTFRFKGTEEQVEKAIRELKKTIKRIAPNACMTITREK